jgi:hypothetical protein
VVADASSGERRWWLVAVVALLAVVAVVAVILLLRDTDDAAPPEAHETAPLTGLPVEGPVRPALVVKVDNVEAARPQTGLPAADVVVEAMVEGGLTRLSAVYSSTDPGEVGPVRSVRPTDLRFAALLGRPALVFSGGAEPVLDLATEAAEAGAVVLVSEASDPAAFSRRAGRQAPHNLYADTGELWAAASDAEVPVALFAFGPAAASTPVTSIGLPFPATRVTYEWDDDRGEWGRSQDETPHVDESQPDRPVAFTNVVVLEVDYSPSVYDERSPVADLRAGGEAWVFRDGAVSRCRWSTDAAAVPRFDLRGDDGTVCRLEPGRTIIELSPGAPSTG